VQYSPLAVPQYVRDKFKVGQAFVFYLGAEYVFRTYMVAEIDSSDISLFRLRSNRGWGVTSMANLRAFTGNEDAPDQNAESSRLYQEICVFHEPAWRHALEYLQTRQLSYLPSLVPPEEFQEDWRRKQGQEVNIDADDEPEVGSDLEFVAVRIYPTDKEASDLPTRLIAASRSCITSFEYSWESGSPLMKTRLGRKVPICGHSSITDLKDGPSDKARFCDISAIDVDPSGSFIAVLESPFRTVRLVDMNNRTVTTIAGDPSRFHSQDGPSSQSAFSRPTSIAMPNQNQIFVLDGLELRVIELLKGVWSTSTVSMLKLSRRKSDSPCGLRWDPHRSALLILTNQYLYSFNLETREFLEPALHLGERMTCCPVSTGSRFLGSCRRYIVQHDSKWDTSKSPKLVAGRSSDMWLKSCKLESDGSVWNALFCDLRDIDACQGSDIVVIEKATGHIRIISERLKVVSTLPFGVSLLSGYIDGPGNASLLSYPTGVAAHGSRVFIADSGNRVIRVIDDVAGNQPETRTLYGSGEPVRRFGSLKVASFYMPVGIEATSDGTLFVIDQGDTTERYAAFVIDEEDTAERYDAFVIDQGDAKKRYAASYADTIIMVVRHDDVVPLKFRDATTMRSSAPTASAMLWSDLGDVFMWTKSDTLLQIPNVSVVDRQRLRECVPMPLRSKSINQIAVWHDAANIPEFVAVGYGRDVAVFNLKDKRPARVFDKLFRDIYCMVAMGDRIIICDLAAQNVSYIRRDDQPSSCKPTLLAGSPLAMIRPDTSKK
jgi:hypothetical protein